MSRKLKVTLIKSGIGTQARHRRTIRALGLKRLNHVVVKEDNPAVRGMLCSVQFLVHVEEVAGS